MRDSKCVAFSSRRLQCKMISIDLRARKRANPTPISRLIGSARFSGTNKVPSSKLTVPVSGMVTDNGSMTPSPALRCVALALALEDGYSWTGSLLAVTQSGLQSRIEIANAHNAELLFITSSFQLDR